MLKIESENKVEKIVGKNKSLIIERNSNTSSKYMSLSKKRNHSEESTNNRKKYDYKCHLNVKVPQKKKHRMQTEPIQIVDNPSFVKKIDYLKKIPRKQ